MEYNELPKQGRIITNVSAIHAHYQADTYREEH